MCAVDIMTDVTFATTLAVIPSGMDMKQEALSPSQVHYMSPKMGGGRGTPMNMSPSRDDSSYTQMYLPTSLVKKEPRLPSPCSSMIYSPVPSKSARVDDTWLSSPGQASRSPTTTVNGHSFSTAISFSPVSTSSFDTYSPGGKPGREDLSPTGSLNGYSLDGYTELKKKKGPMPRQQEELCLVCGDRASGYHYNALTCEGCKGFFRRSITKNAVYQCKYGKNCDIDMYMRRKCQECRLKKCLSVGMRPECVVPEYQCQVKREAKRAIKDKDRPNSTTSSSPLEARDLNIPHVEMCTATGVPKLNEEQKELIKRLVGFQEIYEVPTEEDLKKVTQHDKETDFGENQYKFMTEVTILTVQLIVEFSKRIPGFADLVKEDQISLLKACSGEVMMLRTARRYHRPSDSIVFANNEPYNVEAYMKAGLGDTAEDIFHFCRRMEGMKIENAEYALLTAIVTFSERPNLIEPWKVETLQDIYLQALECYVYMYRPKPQAAFARLFCVLSELRSLGMKNSEMCFSLKLKNKNLPPFLEEIWDIDVTHK